MKASQLIIIAWITTLSCYSINNKSFEALCTHANDFFLAEQYHEAITYYERALELNPQCAGIYFNLGQALYYVKKYPEALDAYKKAIHHNHSHDRAYAQIGKLMLDVNQPHSAIAPLKKALSIAPNNGEVRHLLAKAYNDTQKHDDSIEVITEGLALNPHDINLKFALGNSYTEANKFSEALIIYQELDQQVPNHPSILYNIAFTLKHLEQLDASIEYYNRTLELNPANRAELLVSRAIAYLKNGDFEKGWEGHEGYYKPPYQEKPLFDKPLWDGSDLEGKTLLIYAAYGFGDTFQFIRYAKLVKEKNGIVIAAVKKPLTTIINRCKYIDQVVAIEDTLPHFDVYLPIMSLPYVLKTRLDTIPCEIPYLYADEELTHYWKNKLAADKNFKIGICWQVNENYTLQTIRAKAAQRSIKLEQLIPLLTIPGTTIYSLQKIGGAEQIENLPSSVNIVTFDDDFDQSNGRFMDTAAVIKNLDLIITVDTSIGHLAAGLGTDTWIMRLNPGDWRWLVNRTDSPWYPTVRLFKQPTPGDWATMIDEVVEAVKTHIKKEEELI